MDKLPDIHRDSTVVNFAAWLHNCHTPEAQLALADILLAALQEPLLAGDMLNMLLARSAQLRREYADFVEPPAVQHQPREVAGVAVYA